MKKFYLILIALICSANCFALVKIDSLKQQISPVENRVAELKSQLDSTQNDSVKAILYAEIAAQYLNYDSLENKKTRFAYQNEVLNYTYKALHLFSRYADTVGLRNCFDYLATVYHSQKKFPQAKWFIIQSNSLSRAIHDGTNVMRSLIKMAAIKMDIKDYTLAMRDLNEALKISVANRDPRTESTVQLNYALLYNRMKNPKKGKIAMDRHLFIDDSLHKAEMDMVVKTVVTDSTTVVKKKIQPKLTKKAPRPDSSKKIASL
ncbi:hypothetical protein [Mucilaginibacter auburnensis]|uniref:Tetratricopeptide repeat protein n=1 Tax=Mucilaginibacter auburnensis TaxID=1457233 RepID=A0A2H9VV76_9SPHI|nr:hypothetical protein [Mucilaginibacter auburnensis]PJJ84733.1 hypothetical protein CLV57_1754 [Mucilaginibacter auburnensis]